MKVKKFLIIFISATVFFSTMICDACAYEYVDGVSSATGVSTEMSTSNFWKAQIKESGNTVLMNAEDIAQFNQTALSCNDTLMHDLTSMTKSYDATKRAEGIVADLDSFAASKAQLFINGTAVDRNQYVGAMKEIILATSDKGTLTPRYAVATATTQLTIMPTVDYVGYSKEDFDNENLNASLVVNEPFVIEQKCVFANKLYYWGYTKNCSGWIVADDLAVCSSKAQWEKCFVNNLNGKDFIVVTQDAITLASNIYSTRTSGVRLDLGAALKLVPKSELPRNIAGRGAWNNYAVYLPTRNADGSYQAEIALIPQKSSVSVGYLPMTQNNVIDLAFTCLGNRYGWGGTLDAMDCSLFTQSVYRCFGIELPRNTTTQRKVPNTAVDISMLDDANKVAMIQRAPIGSLLYFSGHTMIYLGTVDGVPYVISATGSLSDSVGYQDVVPMNTVIVTPLTVRRKDGSTWLRNMQTIVNPYFIKF